MLFCRVIIWQWHFLAGSVFGSVPTFCHQVIHCPAVCVCVCESRRSENSCWGTSVYRATRTHTHTHTDSLSSAVYDNHFLAFKELLGAIHTGHIFASTCAHFFNCRALKTCTRQTYMSVLGFLSYVRLKTFINGSNITKCSLEACVLFSSIMWRLVVLKTQDRIL